MPKQNRPGETGGQQWTRVKRYLKKSGDIETANFTIGNIRKGLVSTYVIRKLAQRLMKDDEFESAGKLLRTAQKFAQPHPFVDFEYARWLWAMSQQKRSFAFLSKKTTFWDQSYLWNLLSVIYDVWDDKPMIASCQKAVNRCLDKELADPKAANARVHRLQKVARAKQLKTGNWATV